MRRRLPTRAALFNMMKPSHENLLNAILAEDGRTITVIERKPFMVTGFAAPDFDAEMEKGEPMPTRIKDDAFYYFLVFQVSPQCPIDFTAFRCLDDAARQIAMAAGSPERMRELSDANEPLFDPDDIVIDIQAETAKRVAAKKPRKKAAAKPIRGEHKVVPEPRLNQHGIDVSGVPAFMLVGGATLEDITAIKRDRNGVKGVSIGSTPPAPGVPGSAKKKGRMKPTPKG
jgi:hypothetical protein